MMCSCVYEIRIEEDTREGRPCCLLNVVYPHISGGNDCGLIHIFGQDSRPKESVNSIHKHVTRIFRILSGYWLLVAHWSFFVAEY